MKKRFFVFLTAVIATCASGLVNAQTSAVKIGFTDIDVLLSNHPKAKQVEAELTTRRTQYQNQIQGIQKELQDKGAAYQKGAEQMSEVIRNDKMKELQTLNDRAQTLAQNAETELQQRQQQLLTPLLQEIQTAIDDVAKTNGYTFIISSSINMQMNPVLLYAAPENDVTDLVFKKLGVDPEAVKKAAEAARQEALKQTQQPAKPTTAPKTGGNTPAPKKN